MKKYLFVVIMLALGPVQALACALCTEQQPRFLRSVIHGPGPQGPWDYVIMAVSMAIVLVVLFLSIRYLARPGEKDPGHIKYMILGQNHSAHEQ